MPSPRSLRRSRRVRSHAGKRLGAMHGAGDDKNDLNRRFVAGLLDIGDGFATVRMAA